MDTVKILFFAGLIIVAYQWWEGRESGAAAGLISPNGFISVQMPDGARADTVLVLAPLNCPSEAARRAERLAAGLDELGIPYVRSSSASLRVEDPSGEQQAAVRRSASVLEGEIPAVFINGMGKSNPSIEEVAAEYRRTSSSAD